MTEIAKPVVLGDPVLRFGKRAWNINHDNFPAAGANDMIVVLGGIIQLIIAAGTLEINLMHETQPIEESDHAKDRGIVWAILFGGRQLLDLLE